MIGVFYFYLKKKFRGRLKICSKVGYLQIQGNQIPLKGVETDSAPATHGQKWPLYENCGWKRLHLCQVSQESHGPPLNTYTYPLTWSHGAIPPLTVVFCVSGSPASWSVGNWSTCSRSCGGGTQSRPVQCRRRAHYRDEPISASLCPQPAPSSHQACNSQGCPPAWSTGSWAEVTRWGGEGTEAGPHTVGCSV